MNRVDQDDEIGSLPRFYQGRAFAAFFQNTNGVALDCFQPAGNDMPDRIIAAVIIAETDHQGLQMRCHRPFRKANRKWTQMDTNSKSSGPSIRAQFACIRG